MASVLGWTRGTLRPALRSVYYRLPESVCMGPNMGPPCDCSRSPSRGTRRVSTSIKRRDCERSSDTARRMCLTIARCSGRAGSTPSASVTPPTCAPSRSSTSARCARTSGTCSPTTFRRGSACTSRPVGQRRSAGRVQPPAIRRSPARIRQRDVVEGRVSSDGSARDAPRIRRSQSEALGIRRVGARVRFLQLPHDAGERRGVRPSDGVERLEYFHSYPSAIVDFARHLRTRGLRPPPFRAVSRPPKTSIRASEKEIESFYSARVFSFYGHSENLVIAGECEVNSAYHLFPEYGVAEVLREDGRPAAEGETGEIVGTTIDNFAMPLLRYRTEDQATVGPERCSCGRPYRLRIHQRPME